MSINIYSIKDPVKTTKTRWMSQRTSSFFSPNVPSHHYQTSYTNNEIIVKSLKSSFYMLIHLGYIVFKTVLKLYHRSQAIPTFHPANATFLVLLQCPKTYPPILVHLLLFDTTFHMRV